jgi:hypothetical protein
MVHAGPTIFQRSSTATSATARAGSSGTRRRRTRVMIARVPPLPARSWVRSYPVLSLARPASLVSTVPSGSTASNPVSWSRMLP